jgi:translocation and assembly module TamB
MRIVARTALALVLLALIAVIAGLFISRTLWFKDRLRDKIVSVTENATGGRVEIGRFDYDWSTMTAEVAPFVLHGKEPAGDPPFFRADRVHVGLKIISLAAKKVDVASVVVDKPELRIVVAKDGKSNIPSPKIRRASKKNFVDYVLDLKARHVEVRGGSVEYNSHKLPLDVRGENLHVALRFESATPRYVGEVAARRLHVSTTGVRDAAFDFDAEVALERPRLRVLRSKFTRNKSEIEAAGVMEGFIEPRGDFDVKARLLPADLQSALHLPIAERGQVTYDGKVTFVSEPKFRYALEGHVAGHGLAYYTRYLRLNDASLASELKISPGRLDLPNLTVRTLQGDFRGRFELNGWKRFVLEGNARALPIQEVARATIAQVGDLNGTLAGPVRAEGLILASGLRDVVAQGKLDVAPGTTGVPVAGFVDVNYDQRANIVQFGESNVTLGGSRVQASGVLGRMLTAHVTSKNLNDFLPVFPLFGAPTPKELPISLKRGAARFDGTVSGPLSNPEIAGQVEFTRFVFGQRDFDRLAGNVDLTRSALVSRSLTLEQNGAQAQGTGRIALDNWKVSDASAVSAHVIMRDADIAALLEEIKQKLPITGRVSAVGDIQGTLGAPRFSGNAQAENVTAYEEHADRVRADVTYSSGSLEAHNARVTAGAAQINVDASYQHAERDLKNGQLRFDISGRGLALAQIAHVRKLREGLNGQVEFKASGAANIVKGDLRLRSLDSQTSLRNATFDGRPYGNLTLTANTRDDILNVKASAVIRNTPVEGSGEWRLEGDYPGHGHVVIPRMTVAALHDLLPNPQRRELPFEGFFEGIVDIDGPLKQPDALKAQARISVLQINASQGARVRAGAQASDLVLRNTEPIVLQATTKGIDIASAHFAATNTTLEAQGRISFDSKNPWDLRVIGSINLAILQIFNPDLLASGGSDVRVAVRGPFNEPQVEGRLELKNASLYLADFPNGLDQANGVILFDRGRATVENLGAMTGGGKVSFVPGSFVGFRGPALIYRAQATADHVRYRSEEGVSITVNALLNLVGTSESSVLSGTVTVMRAGFTPRTDIGSLLASAAKPVSTPSTPNEYLRGVQFDVRVESAQSLEVQTSLTRNLEAEANLRVRGALERPVVLGNISVNEGEIEFFGSRYTINRGEVNFYNPAKIEPIIDMDLETRVRGITVDISLSGAINKLNFSYRSDPPLETNQIIALLAVGREPTAVGGLASSQVSANSSYLASGSNALLGQAITAPVAGRLQRFFGVSHIKIDPALTDITSIPQARLTLEQQISKDVTLTYITNLTRTTEQIIRVEWDLNRRWSVIALRDENGAFGIDFQYRKRFK